MLVVKCLKRMGKDVVSKELKERLRDWREERRVEERSFRPALPMKLLSRLLCGGRGAKRRG